MADLFLRDVESLISQDPGRRLVGTGYVVQAMGRCPTTFQNNLFALLVPALTQGQSLVHFWPCTQSSSSYTFPQRSHSPGGAALAPSGGTMVALG